MIKKYMIIFLGALIVVGQAKGSASWKSKLWASSAVAATGCLVLKAAAEHLKQAKKDDLKMVSPGTVRVYHSMHRGGTVEDVRRHGLLTYNELYRRGLAASKPDGMGMLPDQRDVICFRWHPNPPVGYESVGLDVDPDKTYVRNSEFRADANILSYQGPVVSLSDYIARRKEAEELKKSVAPGNVVIFDPYTAKPFCLSVTDYICMFNDRRLNQLNSRHYLYPNEIVIHRPCIPPEELIFPEQDALRA